MSFRVPLPPLSPSPALQSDRVTVSDAEVTVTMPRMGPPEGPGKFSKDGHWGLRVGALRC